MTDNYQPTYDRYQSLDVRPLDASHRNYMEGYLDGVRQLQRDVAREEAQ